jgi:hypothetical protein
MEMRKGSRQMFDHSPLGTYPHQGVEIRNINRFEIPELEQTPNHGGGDGVWAKRAFYGLIGLTLAS